MAVIKYKIGDVRVGICTHTQKLVLQSFEGDDLHGNDAYQSGWLCLHNDDIEEDEKEVLNFIKETHSN